MKYAFISQPMAGKTEEEIWNERDKIATIYDNSVNDKVVILDSFIMEDPKSRPKNLPLWYLGKSLEVLSDADVILLAPGWENNRGCVIEHEAAVKYGLEVVIIDKTIMEAN